MALAAPATPSVASTAIDSETDGEDGWLSRRELLIQKLRWTVDEWTHRNFG